MTTDQATLREFRLLDLGPELSAAIDVVVAAHENGTVPVHRLSGGEWKWDAPKHNMADAA